MLRMERIYDHLDPPDAPYLNPAFISADVRLKIAGTRSSPSSK
jgi:hypothetical protein